MSINDQQAPSKKPKFRVNVPKKRKNKNTRSNNIKSVAEALNISNAQQKTKTQKGRKQRVKFDDRKSQQESNTISFVSLTQNKKTSLPERGSSEISRSESSSKAVPNKPFDKNDDVNKNADFTNYDEQNFDLYEDSSQALYPPVSLPLNECEHTSNEIESTSVCDEGSVGNMFMECLKKFDNLSTLSSSDSNSNIKSNFDLPHLPFFVQLPSHLPSNSSTHNIDTSKDCLKVNAPNSTDNDLNLSSSNSLVDDLRDNSKFNSGSFGDLIMFKSGKTKLVIGNLVLDVNFGLQSQFSQSLVSLDCEKKKMFDFGQISSKKLVCSYDIENMLDTHKS